MSKAVKKTPAKAAKSDQPKPIVTYKGFNSDMKCRDFQYEIGKTYTHDGKISVCNTGFHACEYPLDVFNYYTPDKSVYALVEQGGKTDREPNSDSKVASSSITIKAKISIGDLIKAAFEYTLNRCDPKIGHNTTGDRSASSATGDRSASSATGYQSASSATGYRSASSATGYQSASSATGDQSASEVTGEKTKEAVAVALGYECKARATKGNWIVVAHRNDDGEIKHIKSAKVGTTEGVKPDVWYGLDASGNFVEAA